MSDNLPLAADEANRHYDIERRLHVRRTPITKACVNGYSGAEIMAGAQNGASLSLDKDRIYNLLRDPDELQKALSTANNIQLLRKHVGVSAADPKKNDIAGTLGSEAEWEKPYIYNSLTVWDAEYIAAVEDNKQRQLSSSYRYTADMTPGTYEGTAYDGVMRNISFNHVALVEEGRAGPDVLVSDEKPGFLKGPPMTKISKKVALKALAASYDDQIARLASDALPPVRATLAKLAADARKAMDDADETEMVDDAAMEMPKAKDKKGAKDNETILDDDDDEEDEKKARDKRAKDRKAKDKKAMDEKDESDDGEKEEKEVEREARDRKAKDKAAKDAKCAMDAAIAAAISANDQKHRDIAAAAAAVRPIVGDVLAMDSAEDIYRLGLETQGVDLSDVPKGTAPGVYKALLATATRAAVAAPRLAHDAANKDVRTKFLAEFPGATIPRRA